MRYILAILLVGVCALSVEARGPVRGGVRVGVRVGGAPVRFAAPPCYGGGVSFQQFDIIVPSCGYSYGGYSGGYSGGCYNQSFQSFNSFGGFCR